MNDERFWSITNKTNSILLSIARAEPYITDEQLDDLYNILKVFNESLNELDNIIKRNDYEKSCISNERLKEGHKKMWLWLSEHPLSSKADYFEENDIKDVPTKRCYACAYCAINGKSDCRNCPIVTWRLHAYGGRPACLCYGSPYAKWENSTDLKERSELALEIANLEWRIEEPK